MALIVLLRGVNVGGRRALRPTLLARRLSKFDVVNIGAAGTFVVRKPSPRAQLRAALAAALPATTQFVLCEGRDLLRLATRLSFDEPPPAADVTRFVTFLESSCRAPLSLPLSLPPGNGWCVRVMSLTGRLAVGEYRRHMKTIGYLGRLDTLFGTLVTTRNWNTVNAIVRTLQGPDTSI